MWNLKNKINKQTKQKQNRRYREQTDDFQMGGGFSPLDERGEVIKKYKLEVTK